MSYSSVFSGENAKGRHAKTRQKVILAGYRMATFPSSGKDNRKRNTWNVAYFRVAGRKVAM